MAKILSVFCPKVDNIRGKIDYSSANNYCQFLGSVFSAVDNISDSYSIILWVNTIILRVFLQYYYG
jgi:hypothetical protein